MGGNSWETKMRRAKRHLDALDAEVSKYLAGPPDPVYVREDVRADGLEYAYQGIAMIGPPDVASLIGDFSHNVRSALDAFVWHVADEAERGNHTCFPIIKCRDDYFRKTKKGEWATSSGPHKLGGVPEPFFTTIETLQPFDGKESGCGADTDPLLILKFLSDTDKHRVVHTTTSVLESSEFRAFGPGFTDADIDPKVKIGPFEGAAEIASYRLTKGLSPVEVESDFRFGIAFADPGPIEGWPVVKTLSRVLTMAWASLALLDAEFLI